MLEITSRLGAYRAGLSLAARRLTPRRRPSRPRAPWPRRAAAARLLCGGHVLVDDPKLYESPAGALWQRMTSRSAGRDRWASTKAAVWLRALAPFGPTTTGAAPTTPTSRYPCGESNATFIGTSRRCRRACLGVVSGTPATPRAWKPTRAARVLAAEPSPTGTDSPRCADLLRSGQNALRPGEAPERRSQRQHWRSPACRGERGHDVRLVAGRLGVIDRRHQLAWCPGRKHGNREDAARLAAAHRARNGLGCCSERSRYLEHTVFFTPIVVERHGGPFSIVALALSVGRPRHLDPLLDLVRLAARRGDVEVEDPPRDVHGGAR